MLFNSFAFLPFLLIVLAFYWSPLGGWTVKKLFLLAASYLFYAWWNPPFTLLLVLSTVVDFVGGAMIPASPKRWQKRLWLGLSVGFNLGVLGFFKYAGFFMNSIGWHSFPRSLEILLPVGISFYTFQTMSYTLDVYWGRAKPTRNFLDFALYVTFFPQLVAGPIVRAGEFLWQCERARKFDWDEFFWGICLVSWGLFKKVVCADTILAPVVNGIFSLSGQTDFLHGWVGAYGFSAQIYCDFSGYSDMAVGLALMMGFRILNNFNRPYGSLSFSDFWRRWHISLARLLRDYLYIPLGGNQKGSLRTVRNLMVTMLLGGLWHGAGWNFVVWGGAQGLFLGAERFLFSRFRVDRASLERLPLLFKAVLCLGVFHLTCLAWVLFRMSSLHSAGRMIRAMMGGEGALSPLMGWSALRVLLLAGGIVAWHFIHRHRSMSQVAARLPSWSLGAAAAGLLFLCRIWGPQSRAFIYFQF